MKISGLVCKNFTNEFSRKVADDSIQDYFEKEEMVAISDIDTRAIVRHIRNKGAMNAIISSEETDVAKLKKQLAKVPSMAGLELASKVSTKEPYFMGEEDAKIKIAVLDLGVKKNILKCLASRGCYLKVYPAKTSFDEVKKWNPDGYFISNGPGDPAPMDYATEFTKKVLEADKPLFGICLGHQILAQAVDIPTYKMHHGHRGINHPVMNLETGKSEITSQNHGFGVSPDALENAKDRVQITHVNLNDETIEGIRIKNKKAFSVQYHPEASPGPHDARYLFDQFISMIQESELVS